MQEISIDTYRKPIALRIVKRIVRTIYLEVYLFHMVDGYQVSNYFRRKGVEWASISGSVENHLRKMQRQGIKADFQSDPEFWVVCDYLKQVGELQLRSTMGKSLEGVVGSAFGIPLLGTLDIAIGAAVEACGDTTLGDKLIGAGVVALVVALGGILLGSLFSE